MLLAAQGLVPAGEQPAFVSEWLGERKARAEKRERAIAAEQTPEAQAKAEGCTYVWLDVMEHAEWARAAYERWGFSDIGGKVLPADFLTDPPSFGMQDSPNESYYQCSSSRIASARGTSRSGWGGPPVPRPQWAGE